MELIQISKGNAKLGNIPNISMRPGTDCGNCKFCYESCYARKAYRMYPQTKAGWTKNGELAKRDPGTYFKLVRRFLNKKSPSFFRWHVSGDILNQAYADEMIRIAWDYPETKFLAFTKMHHLRFVALPSNLSIVLSMWPGMPEPESTLPKAWMQDGSETRVPADAIECPGNCETCGMCWALPTLGRDVVFEEH